MPDVYATIAAADLATQERLASVLELRGADPQQRAIVEAYLHELTFPPGGAVLDVGCGTGFVARIVARRSPTVRVVGVDPSPVFIARARELAVSAPNLEFREGDGRAMPFAGGEFDVVIFHTTLSHLPEPARALAEAARLLRAGGTIAVCDGDYSTMSVALGAHDPLQACIAAAQAAYINDVWVARRLPALLRSAGFDEIATRSHGYLQTSAPEYMATLVDRGAEALNAAGLIGPDLSNALKAEGRRRAACGEFFGFIAFTSCIGRRAG
jgi:ubiquinone/menaquinone biosynthesis C-methylase UbiE